MADKSDSVKIEKDNSIVIELLEDLRPRRNNGFGLEEISVDDMYAIIFHPLCS